MLKVFLSTMNVLYWEMNKQSLKICMYILLSSIHPPLIHMSRYTKAFFYFCKLEVWTFQPLIWEVLLLVFGHFDSYFNYISKVQYLYDSSNIIMALLISIAVNLLQSFLSHYVGGFLGPIVNYESLFKLWPALRRNFIGIHF